MASSFRSGLGSVFVGCIVGLLAATAVASWHAAQARQAVCHEAAANVMDLFAGDGHVDPDSGSSWLAAPDVDVLVTYGQPSGVHDIRCGFTAASLLLRRPVLQSLAVDELLISPIRLKLLGIALGIAAEPSGSLPRSG
jgi:hypothetical protein